MNRKEDDALQSFVEWLTKESGLAIGWNRKPDPERAAIRKAYVDGYLAGRKDG